MFNGCKHEQRWFGAMADPFLSPDEALRQSELRTRLIVDAARDAFIAINVEGVVTDWNPQAETIFGWPREAVLGQPLTDLIIPPQHREAHLRGLQHFLATGEGPMLNQRIELTALHRDGHEFPVEMTITSIQLGDDYLFSAFLHDITERKRAEAAQARTVEQLELLQRIEVELTQKLNIDYVLSMALDVTLRLSRADAACIGLAEGKGVRIVQAIGHYPDSAIGVYIPPDEGIIGRAMRRRQAELVADVAQAPEYIPAAPSMQAEMVIPLISQDRLVGVLNLETANPQRFTPQRFEFLKLITGRIAAAIDNAQLYQQSQAQLAELRAVYDKVSALEQLKTDMIRIAAHDLRNPISIMGGYLYYLYEDLRSYLSPAHEEAFAAIQRAITRMETITNDILSLEKIEQAAHHREKILLHRLVAQVYRDQEEEARRKGQDYRLEAPPDPLVVWGDPMQLYEGIANLVGNAIKYTPEGGSVQVRLAREADSALFEVEDTGYGVPENQQARLFEPFFRAKTEETQQIAGTGLGLHLVKNIVERHEGQMCFKSVYRQGSTFGFRLPLWQES